jgi:hypothetical protein
MRRLLLGVAALLTAAIVFIPDEASAYWRGGWRGPGWGGYRLTAWGGYRPIYGPSMVAPVLRVAPIIAMAPAPILVIHPMRYGYAAPFAVYGYYGYRGYGYRACVTDDGYGRYRSCDR